MTVPVANIDAWTGCRSDLEKMLAFLTSDIWHVELEQAAALPAGTPDGTARVQDLVCLFSGGSDSICGAIQALVEGRKPIFLSHWDWSVHAGVQVRLMALLRKHFKIDTPHIQVNIGRLAKQIGGAKFAAEPSRRSRSLLFITLGLAVGSIGKLPLWVPENGFTSLNPPLAAERLGALSTRTTHPRFLAEVQHILTAVGAHATIETPFAHQTKGEMFASVAKKIGSELASEILSQTHSCSHARWAGMYHMSPETQCGICLGCLVRRGAFARSGLEDRTTYLVNDLPGNERKRFLSAIGQAEIEAARYAVTGSYGEADVLSMDLPEGSDLEEALSLVRRGFAEMGKVELP